MIRAKKPEDLEKGSLPEKESFIDADKKDLDAVWALSSEQKCLTNVLPCKQVEGENYLFYGAKRGDSAAFPTHCIMGPDYVCSFFTSFMIIGANLYWFRVAIVGLNKTWILVGLFLGFSLWLSYSKTAYTDPGIVKRLTKTEFNQLPKQSDPVCRICNIYRSSGTRHCYDCDACILEHDHHCPWTGKCIGKYNMGYFTSFIAFLFIDLIFVIVTSVMATAKHH